MKTDREYTPTSQELNKTFQSLTKVQKLQLKAIIGMVTALVVSVHQTSRTEENISKSKN